jgi:disulfide bond formation protein DsbB
MVHILSSMNPVHIISYLFKIRQYYLSIYTYVSQVVSSPNVYQLKLCMYILSLPYVIHDLPYLSSYA